MKTYAKQSLRTIVRVVPECTSLAGSRELILERMVGSDWALVDANRTISPATTSLEEAMPVLEFYFQHHCMLL